MLDPHARAVAFAVPLLRVRTPYSQPRPTNPRRHEALDDPDRSQHVAAVHSNWRVVHVQRLPRAPTSSHPKHMHRSSSSHPKCMHRSSSSHPKCMRRSLSSHPKCMRRSSSSHPKCMHRSSSSHPKYMRRSSSSHPKYMRRSSSTRTSTRERSRTRQDLSATREQGSRVCAPLVAALQSGGGGTCRSS